MKKNGRCPYFLRLSFYGFGIEVRCQDAETLQNIKRDYSFFVSDAISPAVFFEISNETYDYNALPPLKACLYTQRSISYRHKNLAFIDYFGKALAIAERGKNIYRIFCADSDLRHEIAFLCILAVVNRGLESRNIHRVHSLGVEIDNKAFLILLPMGGGKTTLLLELLKNKKVKLISEDSPLIDSSGKLLPFPLRVGISYRDKPSNMPDEYLRFVKRTELDPKYLIDIEFFKDRISEKALPAQSVFCGRRCLGKESYIKAISKYKALREFVKNCVLGEGLHKGIQLLPKRSLFELFGLVLSRFKNSAKVIFKCKTYSFTMGFDRKKNAETFLKFISL